jgi:ADP-dependent NAD(P)H-hydrate dehydratase / NAD(P)H-hydrate epimerase
MKLISVSKMQAVEKEADQRGLSYAMMMDNAGHNLAAEVLKLAYSQEDEEEIQVLGLVGPGNNGGDTLVALARLAEKGWTARAYLVNRKSENDPLLSRLEQADGEIYQARDDDGFHQLQAFMETADVLLDGVLGTGITLPLKPEVGGILSAARDIVAGMDWPPLVVAVDCPSGVNCDTGEASAETIPADATVTMAAIKRGLLALPAFGLAGEIRVVGIGDLSGLESWDVIKDEVADDTQVMGWLPQRGLDAHKGTFGTALIAAGSLNYTGAALLAGEAAAQIGTGLVTLAVPSPLHAALAGHFPEATWVLLPHEMGVIASAGAEVLLKNIERATALLIGPGLGLEETTRDFLHKVLTGKEGGTTSQRHIGFVQEPATGKTTESGKGLPAMVIDADGLKHLAKIENWQNLIPATAILTPHPGEMATLTCLTVGEIQADRLAIARKYASEWGQVVVLKGAFTVVAAPDGRTTTIPCATAALAHAGTGDVLAGLIVGLRAQGVEAYEAAVAGAYLHAKAGEAAEQARGSSAAVLARDVLDGVVDVLSGLG